MVVPPPEIIIIRPIIIMITPANNNQSIICCIFHHPALDATEQNIVNINPPKKKAAPLSLLPAFSVATNKRAGTTPIKKREPKNAYWLKIRSKIELGIAKLIISERIQAIIFAFFFSVGLSLPTKGIFGISIINNTAIIIHIRNL